MILRHLITNADTRERSEVAELRSRVDFLERNFGQQITEDDFLSVQKTLEEIYPLLYEYEIDIPDIQCVIDYDVCVACGVCEEVCPTEAIVLNDDFEIKDIELDACIGCGLCEEECPVEAIKIFVPMTSEMNNNAKGTRMPRNLEAFLQFKITTKRSSDNAL